MALALLKKGSSNSWEDIKTTEGLARDRKEWTALQSIYSPTRERQELSKEL